MFSKQIKEELFFGYEKLKASIEAILAVNMVDGKTNAHAQIELWELIKNYVNALNAFYRLFSQLEKLHSASPSSDIGLHITERLNAILEESHDDASLSNEFNLIQELCMELLEKISFDIQQFKQTISLFPMQMTKRQLEEFVELYDQHRGNQEDDLIKLVRKFMRTPEFLELYSSEKVVSNKFMNGLDLGDLKKLAYYYATNANEEEQTFLYKLMLAKSFAEMTNTLNELAISHNSQRLKEGLSFFEDEISAKVGKYLNESDLVSVGRSCRFFQTWAQNIITERKKADQPAKEHSRDYLQKSEYREIDFKSIFYFRDNGARVLCLGKMPLEDFTWLDGYHLALCLSTGIYIFTAKLTLTGSYTFMHDKTFSIPSQRIIVLNDNLIAILNKNKETTSVSICDWKNGEILIEERDFDMPIDHIEVRKNGKYVLRFQDSTYLRVYDSRLQNSTPNRIVVPINVEDFLIRNNKLIYYIPESRTLGDLCVSNFKEEKGKRKQLIFKDVQAFSALPNNVELAFIQYEKLNILDLESLEISAQYDMHGMNSLCTSFLPLPDNKFLLQHYADGKINLCMLEVQEGELRKLAEMAIVAKTNREVMVSPTGNIMLVNLQERKFQTYNFPHVRDPSCEIVAEMNTFVRM